MGEPNALHIDNDDKLNIVRNTHGFRVRLHRFPVAAGQKPLLHRRRMRDGPGNPYRALLQPFPRVTRDFQADHRI